MVATGKPLPVAAQPASEAEPSYPSPSRASPLVLFALLEIASRVSSCFSLKFAFIAFQSLSASEKPTHSLHAMKLRHALTRAVTAADSKARTSSTEPSSCQPEWMQLQVQVVLLSRQPECYCYFSSPLTFKLLTCKSHNLKYAPPGRRGARREMGVPVGERCCTGSP
jgi:hypothetical protein